MISRRLFKNDMGGSSRSFFHDRHTICAFPWRE